jgi:adenosylhomocysteine nucleosidase
MKSYKFLVALVLMLGIAAALTFTPGNGLASPKPQGLSNGLDNAPRTAIISAFGAELDAFKAQATIQKTVVLNGRSVYIGVLGGHKVVMTLSGESMVNAAMAAQVLIDHFSIEQIVFSGIAGGVNPSLNIGDVVIPAQWAEYQENLFARETAPDVYTPPFWFQPILPNYGMMFPEQVGVTNVNGQPDQETETLWFPVDPNMLAVAQQAVGNVELDQCTPQGVCLSEVPIIKVGGNGVSGPTFVDNAEYRQYAWSTWSADALDMESSAVAHVASVNGVPFIVFRSLSDLAGGGPGENEVGIFFQLAANNSAKVMLAFLNALPDK